MSLDEAAKYVGLPPGVLHALAWANAVKTQQPKSYWQPTFIKSDLDDWLSSQGAKLKG